MPISKINTSLWMKDASIPRWIRSVALMAVFACSGWYPVSAAHGAPQGLVEMAPLTISPARLFPGEYPNIETRVRQRAKTARGSVVVNIVAVVTQPDHRVRSWNWTKVRLSRSAPRTIIVPREYDTSFSGTYRVEIVVYSEDMRRRYARRSRSFTVVSRQVEKGARGRGKGPAGGSTEAEREGFVFGMGAYGNALNPAGGGTILLWPSRYVGVQGLYSIGAFTTYEGRLLVKYDLSPKYGLYGGIGYIHVTTDKDIIGVTTRFEDSRMSGVIGMEASLGSGMFLYLESSASGIDLERTVTNGTQTVRATVKYAPVTIGIGLVVALF